MVFKTHALPDPQYKKVIHLIRDGRDVMVSYYKMGVNKNINFPYSLKDMVVDGKGVSPTKWHIHTNQWIDNPYNAEILSIKYEDLQTKPVDTLQNICAFINIEMSDKRLEAIINHNTIDTLRERVSKFGMDNDQTWKNKPITSFFRNGKIGSHKNEMDEKLIVFFNEESKTELEHFNYL
jgi:hypothetical protein